jgi:hypothetical protein
MTMTTLADDPTVVQRILDHIDHDELATLVLPERRPRRHPWL